MGMYAHPHALTKLLSSFKHVDNQIFFPSIVNVILGHGYIDMIIK